MIHVNNKHTMKVILPSFILRAFVISNKNCICFTCKFTDQHNIYQLEDTPLHYGKSTNFTIN